MRHSLAHRSQAGGCSPYCFSRAESAGIGTTCAGTRGQWIGLGWIEGDRGHGKAYQLCDPNAHLLELYYETEKYHAPEALRPAFKNQPQSYSDYGVSVRRLDHMNFLGRNPMSNRTFLQEFLGAKLTEQIILDNGTEAGNWLTFTNKSYDVVFTKDATDTAGRLHHIAY